MTAKRPASDRDGHAADVGNGLFAAPKSAAQPQGGILSAKTILELLRAHYLPEGRYPAGVFLPEIQAPESNRRADLIWVDCSESNRGVVGHEIKVTRSDLAAELADGTKADSWIKHCTQWWLVVPGTDLVAGLDIPDTWGIMTPPSGRRRRSMTVARPAPRLRSHAEVAAMVRLAARMRNDCQDLDSRRADAERRVERLEQINSELRHAPTGEHPTPETATVAEILRQLGGVKPWGIGGLDQDIKIDDVVAALRDLGQIQARSTRAVQTLQAAERDIARLQTLLSGALRHGGRVG